MTICFVSNYLTHHQLPICLELIKRGIDLKFVSCEPVPEEKISFGYSNLNDSYSFVIKKYESKKTNEYAKKIINDCDVAIVGVWNKEISNRIKNKKPTIRMSERFQKPDSLSLKYLLRALKYRILSKRERHIPLLCCGKFAKKDFSFYKNKFVYGYFTSTEKNSIMRPNKKTNSFVWAGRLIDWKHPEMIIQLSKKLVSDGIVFTFDVVGDGPLYSYLAELIKKNNLNKIVVLHGSKKYDEVQSIMSTCEFHLFSSDSCEGWGAVLNESMSTYCIPFCDCRIGASCMINNQQNGYLYDGSFDDLYSKVVSAINLKKEEKCRLANNAYNTVVTMWSPKIVAHRLITFCNRLLNGQNLDIFDIGPLSREN